MLNTAGYRKYRQNGSLHVKFQRRLNEVILFRNENKCSQTIKGKRGIRNIKSHSGSLRRDEIVSPGG